MSQQHPGLAHSLGRRGFIGGSDARVIMGNDEVNLVRLWREKRGEVEPEDLSENLIVQLGTVTEELNRRWYERNTGLAIKDVQRRPRLPQKLPSDILTLQSKGHLNLVATQRPLLRVKRK